MKFLKLLLSFPVRLKIAFAIFLLIITLIGSVLFIIKHEFKINSYSLSKHSAQNLIDSNKDLIIKLLLEDDYWQIYKFLSSLAKLDFINSAGLIDKYGNVIADTNPLKYKIGSPYTFSKTDDIKIPLIQSKMNFGTFVFETNKEYTQPYYDRIKDKLYLFIFIATLISIYLGYIISSRILKRLEILSRNAKKIQKKQWNDLEFIHTLENDEITNIVLSIENMMETVQDMIKQEEHMKKFYHKIIEHINELIIIVDKSSNQITYHNKNILTDKIIQNNTFHTDFQVHIDEMQKYNIDTCTIRWNNQEKYLFISKTKLDDKSFALAISDISELKKIEEQRQMTNSFKLINDLSAMLIHEIKNMLQPLKLLLFHGKPGKEELHRADKIIQKIDNIVFDILHPCKPMDFATKAIEVNKYVDEVLFFLSSLLQKNQINIKLNIENDIGLFIHEEDFKKILLNLLSNSIEASDKNKNIFIKWHRINSQYGCLKIIDEGYGIDLKIQEEIKKPFFTTKKHGSGIGLFSVYKITYLYNGYIELYSNPGKTEFKIYLPIRRKIV